MGKINNRKINKSTEKVELNINDTRNIRISKNIRRMLEASIIVNEDQLVEKVINIYYGDFTTLSTKVLRELISNDKELLNEFNNESEHS